MLEGQTLTVICTEMDASHLEILYHLDRDLKLKHLRLNVTKDTVGSSISIVYPAAFLAENEIQDLFNISFSGLAIDFARTLYLEEAGMSAPFCRYPVSDTAPEPSAAPPEPV